MLPQYAVRNVNQVNKKMLSGYFYLPLVFAAKNGQDWLTSKKFCQALKTVSVQIFGTFRIISFSSHSPGST